MNAVQHWCVVSNTVCELLHVHCPDASEANLNRETELLVNLFDSLLSTGHHVIHQREGGVLLHLHLTSNETLTLHVEVGSETHLVQHGCFDVLVILNHCAYLVEATRLFRVNLQTVKQCVLSNHRQVTVDELLHEHLSTCASLVVRGRQHLLHAGVVPVHGHVDVVLNQHGAILCIQLTESHFHRVGAHEHTVVLD